MVYSFNSFWPPSLHVNAHDMHFVTGQVLAVLLIMSGCGSGGNEGPSAKINEWQIRLRSFNALSVADLNGDSANDIVLTEYIYSEKIATSSKGASVEFDLETATIYDAVVYMQDSLNPGNFIGHKRYILASESFSIETGDLNQNGLPDLGITQFDDDTVRVLFNDEGNPGQFLFHSDYPVAMNPRCIAIGDLNSDNLNDIAVGGDNLVFLENSSPNSGDNFSIHYIDIANTTFITSVTIADMDGDSRNDLVVTSGGMATVIMQEPEPVAPGTFVASTSYNTGRKAMDNVVHDFNNDTLPDIAVAIDIDEGGNVSVHSQDPLNAGVFFPATYYPITQNSKSIAYGDLSDDSIPDLVVANDGPDNGSVSILIQDDQTTGTFLTAVNYPGVSGPKDVATSDMNGDGFIDVVVADNSTLPIGSPYIRFQDANDPGEFLDPSPLP